MIDLAEIEKLPAAGRVASDLNRPARSILYRPDGRMPTIAA